MKDKLRPSRIVLALLAAGILLVLILSDRPWRGYQMPRVQEIAVVPDNPRTAAVRRYTELGSGIFPYIGGRRPELEGRRAPLKLGFAYEEQGILGMPYRVTDEYGLVTYLELPDGIQFGALAPGQRPLLDAMIGRPLTRDFEFRWYLQTWGWLFALGFLLWLYLWRREDLQEEQRLLDSMQDG